VSRWSVEGLAASLERFELGPVDLDVGPGEVVAVLGSSGAGKTTLLRALAGFLPARAGRVVRDGVDLRGWAPERRGLGYVPQGLGLFPHRTVEANVRYPLELRGRLDAGPRAREMLERFGLSPLARRYPAQLSGGERERVALARALLAEPELVLWDEPWQALDVGARHELGGVFDELRERARVPSIVVTHDPGFAFSVADRFLVLKGGRPGYYGAPEGLLRSPVDAFTARFAGFENVYAPEALGRAAPGSLGAWLRELGGPEGVAFARPAVAVPGTGRWEGVVRSARPTPEGTAVTVLAGPLTVALRLAEPAGSARPQVGERLRFDVEERAVRRLAGAAGTEPGRAA